MALIDEQDVAAGGTPEALTTDDNLYNSVTIKAKKANTNPVFVQFFAAVQTTGRFPLDASEAVTLPLQKLTEIWIDATTNGEGVTFVAA